MTDRELKQEPVAWLRHDGEHVVPHYSRTM